MYCILIVIIFIVTFNIFCSNTIFATCHEICCWLLSYHHPDGQYFIDNIVITTATNRRVNVVDDASSDAAAAPCNTHFTCDDCYIWFLFVNLFSSLAFSSSFFISSTFSSRWYIFLKCLVPISLQPPPPISSTSLPSLCLIRYLIMLTTP